MTTQPLEKYQPKLLVIDDDEGITDLIRAVTEEMDFSVICVNDFESIGSTFKSFNPDIIFLDLRLPGYDGVEVLHFLADIGCTAKIFLISGIDKSTLLAAGEVGKQYNLEIAGTLNKPFLIEDIKNVLEAEYLYVSRFTTKEFQSILGHGEFVLTYLPIMAIKTLGGSAISSIEVIVSWVSQDKVNRPASAIMARLCAANLQNVFTHSLIDKALEIFAGWRKSGLELGLTLKMDDEMFLEQSFPNYLANVAFKYGVTPDALTVGISENTALSSDSLTLDLLTRLRIKGFNIAIETDGADVSKLDRLLHLPINELRLHWRTIKGIAERDPEAEFNVSTLISLCDKQGINTCAIGIDTKQCFTFLYECGCTSGQGRYFSDPLNASEIERFVIGDQRYPSERTATL